MPLYDDVFMKFYSVFMFRNHYIDILNDGIYREQKKISQIMELLLIGDL